MENYEEMSSLILQILKNNPTVAEDILSKLNQDKPIISEKKTPSEKTIVGFRMKGEEYNDKNFTNSYIRGLMECSKALKIERMKDISRTIVTSEFEMVRSSNGAGFEYRPINGGWAYVKGSNKFRYNVIKRIANELNWHCDPIHE